MAALGTRRRLAGFAHTLRDNGFRVGLAETRDALQVLTSPAALRPTLLKPALRALFCATHSDWERFDEIFDAFWQGRGMRQRQILSGIPSASHAPARKLAEAHVPQDALGLPDRIERRSDGDGKRKPKAGGAVRALRASKNWRQPICATSSIPKRSRQRMRSQRGSPASCAPAWCAATKSAAAAGGSICAAPFIAMSPMAVCRSISPGAAAR